MADGSESDLRRLGVKQPLGEYLAEIWHRREFATVVPANDLRAQNMDTALGQLWHILNPAALIAIYWVVFGVLLGTDRGIDNFLGFLTVGMMVFQLTQRVVQDGAVAIPRNEGLIRSIQFPRALLPLSSVTGQTIAYIPALGVTLVTVLLSGESPSVRWIVYPLVLFGQTCFNAGGALISARMGSTVRDLQQILPHLFRLVFYMSGILFSVERVLNGRSLFGLSDEAMISLNAINPIYAYVTATRWCLLDTEIGIEIVLSCVVWAVVTPIVGILFFRAREHRYGA